MNSIVGSKSSSNIYAPETAVREKPSNLKMGSQFLQLFQRIEKASSNIAEDWAAPFSNKSTEFQYEEAYPQCRDELLKIWLLNMHAMSSKANRQAQHYKYWYSTRWRC